MNPLLGAMFRFGASRQSGDGFPEREHEPLGFDPQPAEQRMGMPTPPGGWKQHRVGMPGWFPSDEPPVFRPMASASPWQGVFG